MKCRHMSKVVKNQLNANQKKTINNEFLKLLDDYDRQTAIADMCVLRFDEGYGMKRLKRHLKRLIEFQKTIRERYEACEDDVSSICEIRLRESGIDVDELFRAVKSE